MSAAPPVRLGLLGCGWIAGNRLRQIATDRLADVVLVVDPAPEACAAVAAWAPAARVEADLQALTDGSVDGVMISTPSGLHAAQAEALLEHGVPVFVQKPLGISATQVARVLAAGARSDVPVDTDLCYRHLHSARALREAVRANSIGEPFYIEACFHNAYRPNATWSVEPRLAGGGALMDLGVHLIDLVVWLTERRAALGDVHLRQRGRRLAEGEVEDFARLELTLEGDVDVQLVSSWDASSGRDADIRLTIYGEHGNLELVNRAGSFFDFDARRCFGTWVDPLAQDNTDQWQAGPLRHWLRAVRSRAGYQEPAGVRHTAALIDAAYSLGRLPGAREALGPSGCGPGTRPRIPLDGLAGESGNLRRSLRRDGPHRDRR